VFRGAFGVGRHVVDSRGRMVAATLACGEGSVVSHGTAAVLLGLWEHRPQLVDVIAPVESGRRISGIRRRHTPPPLPRDEWLWDGVPCTSPSRTIVDVAGIVREGPLRRAIEQAAVRQMLDLGAIEEILAGPRRRGSRQLRAVLEDWRGYSPGTRLRSPMEARFLAMLAAHDVPAPECNAILWIGGEKLEVDFYWRRQRFVVETDGAKYHDNPQAQARDQRRDRILAASGIHVWRLRWADLVQRPEATMAKLTDRLRSS
jgi:hypothetical protein